jgi:hypothetical protein
MIWPLLRWLASASNNRLAELCRVVDRLGALDSVGLGVAKQALDFFGINQQVIPLCRRQFSRVTVGHGARSADPGVPKGRALPIRHASGTRAPLQVLIRG